MSVKSKTEMKNISFFIKVKFSFENVELEIDAYLLDFLWYMYELFLNNLFFINSVSNNFHIICLRESLM